MEYKTITDAEVKRFANIKITNAHTDTSVSNNINHANLGVYDISTINNTPTYDDQENEYGKKFLQARCITCALTAPQCYGGYGYVDISPYLFYLPMDIRRILKHVRRICYFCLAKMKDSICKQCNVRVTYSANSYMILINKQPANTSVLFNILQLTKVAELYMRHNVLIPSSRIRPRRVKYTTGRYEYIYILGVSYHSLVLWLTTKLLAHKVTGKCSVEIQKRLYNVLCSKKRVPNYSSYNTDVYSLKGMSVTQLLNTKKGIFHQIMNGRRIENCARAVVTGHVFDIRYVIIPQHIIRTLRKRIRINWIIGFMYHGAFQRNIQRLLDTLLQQTFENVYSSKTHTIYNLNKQFLSYLISLFDKEKQLTNEYYVERAYVDDDIMVINRTPTLRAEGIIASKIKINPDPTDATIHIPVLLTTPMNADFDGDEIHVFGMWDADDLIMYETMSIYDICLSTQKPNDLLIKPIQDVIIAICLVMGKYSSREMAVDVNNTSYICPKITIFDFLLRGCVLHKPSPTHYAKDKRTSVVTQCALLTLFGTVFDPDFTYNNATNTITIRDNCVTVSIPMGKVVNEDILSIFRAYLYTMGKIRYITLCNRIQEFAIFVLRYIPFSVSTIDDILKDPTSNDMKLAMTAGAKGNITRYTTITSQLGYQPPNNTQTPEISKDIQTYIPFTSYLGNTNTPLTLDNRKQVFINQCFMKGLNIRNMFIHAKRCRNNILISSTKIASVGYASKINISKMENIWVDYSYDITHIVTRTIYAYLHIFATHYVNYQREQHSQHQQFKIEYNVGYILRTTIKKTYIETLIGDKKDGINITQTLNARIYDIILPYVYTYIPKIAFILEFKHIYINSTNVNDVRANLHTTITNDNLLRYLFCEIMLTFICPNDYIGIIGGTCINEMISQRMLSAFHTDTHTNDDTINDEMNLLYKMTNNNSLELVDVEISFNVSSGNGAFANTFYDHTGEIYTRLHEDISVNRTTNTLTIPATLYPYLRLPTNIHTLIHTNEMRVCTIYINDERLLHYVDNVTRLRPINRHDRTLGEKRFVAQIYDKRHFTLLELTCPDLKIIKLTCNYASILYNALDPIIYIAWCDRYFINLFFPPYISILLQATLNNDATSLKKNRYLNSHLFISEVCKHSERNRVHPNTLLYTLFNTHNNNVSTVLPRV